MRGDHLANATLLGIGSDPKTRPWARLGGFERITVESGEERSVTLEIPLGRLAVVEGDVPGRGKKVAPAGTYVVFLEGTRLQFRVTQTVLLE